MEEPNKTEKTIQELLRFSIINIDKPSGPTSFDISDFVRRTLGVAKTSHFGTLDPKVTGVLPIALGRACKLTGFFLGHDKTYVGVMHTAKENSIKEIQKIINENFSGKIKQLPPKKSRVKRQEREREIISFDIIEVDETGKNFVFKTKVQGGTYIRKLVHDLGLLINVQAGGKPHQSRAHMAELRRVQAGIFSENDKGFTNLYDFAKAVEEFDKGNEEKLRRMLVPAEEAIKKILPVVQVREDCVSKLLTGKPLFKQDVVGEFSRGELFAVFCGKRFIEIAKKVDEGDIIGRSEFVYN
jgi:H/ACA ribonucleoprotein complex subunit 4